MTTPRSSHLLAKIQASHATPIDLTLRPEYVALLQKLGDPHRHLPPVFHVAGTNGKGSTCAFLRAFLESGGKKVHMYTSPHLIHFHERIYLAGQHISEAILCAYLEKVMACSTEGISFFEATTAAAFCAMAEIPADVAIIEVGLGGRLDATNVIAPPLASLITRISFDHREYLGDTLEKIAREKAGIIKQNIPCYVQWQPAPDVHTVFKRTCAHHHSAFFYESEDWQARTDNNQVIWSGFGQHYALPLPSLAGEHQVRNAALAMAALQNSPLAVSPQELARGMAATRWPARLQKLDARALLHNSHIGAEIWLDGAHNDSGAEALACVMREWKSESDQPIIMLCGMLRSKNPAEFLAPFAGIVDHIMCFPFEAEYPTWSGDELATAANHCGLHAVSAPTLQDGLHAISRLKNPQKVIITGSLYLAGHVLQICHNSVVT
ncbi:MAG: bifunctional folylpolyglutamate synthase/dihydrofolate synthase [Alphaproteobacteria bacterium]|nr:bifunctional folylpolyglutamate synthase/dihydrofolate synthase [Alphaproteobacteria bacterium]